MTKKTKIISATVLTLMIALMSITLLFCPFATIKTEAQIESLLDEVSMRIEASLNFDGSYYVNNMPLGFSSNPYDYIKNNSEYNKLVALGADAIPIIEQYISETTSLYGYILSIAIEDIAKINLKNFDEYKWSTSSTFLESWSNVKKDVDKAVYNIYYNENLSDTQKTAQIIKYGILALEPLENIQESLSVELYTESDADQNSAVSLVTKIKNIINTSDRDLLIDMALKIEKTS